MEKCINYDGSFHCSCPEGYTSLDEGKKCLVIKIYRITILRVKASKIFLVATFVELLYVSRKK